jgi:hypothetical protein
LQTFVFVLLSLGAADGFTCDGGKNQKEYGEIYQPMGRVHPPWRISCSRAPGKLDYFDNQITVKNNIPHECFYHV